MGGPLWPSLIVTRQGGNPATGFGYSIAFTYSGYTRTRADLKRRIWARIDGDGARLSGRAPASDQSVLERGQQQALDELAALAERLALTIQLRR